VEDGFGRAIEERYETIVVDGNHPTVYVCQDLLEMSAEFNYLLMSLGILEGNGRLICESGEKVSIVAEE
jgi:hypothetical protein